MMNGLDLTSLMDSKYLGVEDSGWGGPGGSMGE